MSSMKWTAPSDGLCWDTAFGCTAPVTLSSVSQKTACDEVSLECGVEVRGVEQDVVFFAEEDGWKLYGLCDGHAGIEAAEYIRDHLWTTLKSKLPCSRPSRDDGFASWAAVIRQAIVHTFAEVDEDFASKHGSCEAGSTLTLALLCGRFLTVANVGDSEAVLDTGDTIEVMTDSHRLEESEKERTRLKKAGMTLARLAEDLMTPAIGESGVGPRRSWPGGLANGRSIGDVDGGKHIISAPHIKQCLLPERGCRLILGSDGLWDVVDHSSACFIIRNNLNTSSAERLVTVSIFRNSWTVSDDITVVVIDFLPSIEINFPSICKQLKKRNRMPFCFCGSPVEGEPQDSLVAFAEVDGVNDQMILSALDKYGSCSTESIASES